MNKLDNKFDINQIAKLIGMENDLDDADEWFIENNYCECSDELQGQGKCECGFESQRSEYFNEYKNAIEQVAEKLLNEHGLTLVPANKKSGEWEKLIVPVKNWSEAANKIRETINGVGYFEFNSLKEFLDSGPYTPRGAVLNHIGWLKSWYEVYGDANAEYQVERMMR